VKDMRNLIKPVAKIMINKNNVHTAPMLLVSKEKVYNRVFSMRSKAEN
jgi:hypothetical protein